MNIWEKESDISFHKIERMPAEGKAREMIAIFGDKLALSAIDTILAELLQLKENSDFEDLGTAIIVDHGKYWIDVRQVISDD